MIICLRPAHHASRMKMLQKVQFLRKCHIQILTEFFSQLFPQKTCFSYFVHGAILTSWPHGLAKVISDCPALQIAPAGLPAVTLRFQRLDNPPLINAMLPIGVYQCVMNRFEKLLFLFFVLKNYCTILRLS